MSKAKHNCMDQRCPRHLKELPSEWCGLAVMRLRAIRTAGRELTEEEESKLPGCPWCIAHQMANYCFFKYIKEFMGEKPPSEVEVASLIGVSPETVKKIEKTAIAKVREHGVFKELRDSHDGDAVVEQSPHDEDYKIYR